MRKAIIIILSVLVLFSIAGCTQSLNQYETQFLGTFDTIVSVSAYDTSSSSFTETASSIYQDFDYLNKLFDIYNDYEGINNIKTINDNAGKAVEVDRPIIDLLLEAKQWYAATGGAVNVALGPVLSIWHDYRTAGIEDPDNAQLPPMELLEEAAQHCDIDKIIIDEQAATVLIEDGMSIDVGAIAKGFATQYTAAHIIDQGIDHVLISAGGNVRAIGAPVNGRTKWGVGIKDPDSTLAYSLSEENILDAAYIDSMSVVTSGIYERYYTVDGTNYHHIIDPSTLMPAAYYKSVTVITQNSTQADALSTALFVMPPEESYSFVRSMDGVEALWVMADGEIVLSDGMAQYLRDLGGATNE